MAEIDRAAEVNAMIGDSINWTWWTRDEDGLIDFENVSAARPSTITYGFPTSIPGYYSDPHNGFTFPGFTSFTAITTGSDQQKAIDRILDTPSDAFRVSFSDVIPLSFSKDSPADDDTQLTFVQASGPQKTPGRAEWSLNPTGPDDDKAAVVLNKDKFSTIPFNAWNEGTAGYFTVMHEVGHTLGLARTIEHTGIFQADPSLASYADSVKYTVMSYADAQDHGTKPYTLQLLDIAALQQIWQTRNYTHNYGTNTYELTPSIGRPTVPHNLTDAFYYTIWDGGGNDTIDVSALDTAMLSGAEFEMPAQIDLRQGRFSSIGATQNSSLNAVRMRWDHEPNTTSPDPRKAAPVDAGPDPGNVAIAYYTVIEN